MVLPQNGTRFLCYNSLLNAIKVAPQIQIPPTGGRVCSPPHPWAKELPNIDYLVIFAASRLSDYIGYFQYKVECGGYYQEMDYMTNMKLMDLADGPMTVTFHICSARTDVVGISFADREKHTFLFLSTDHSFGSFLFDLYRKENSIFQSAYHILFSPPAQKKEATSVSDKIGQIDINDSGLVCNKIVCNPNYDISDISISDISITSVDDYNRLNKHTDSRDSATQSKTSKTEDKNIMSNFNLDFGPCGDNIRMSLYGLAVKNASGAWVSYDKDNNCIMDVEILNFEAGDFFYKFPVGLAQIQVGDIIMHACKPMFVIAINTEAGTLSVVDPVQGEKKDIFPTKSPFGFNFVVKIVSLFDGMDAGKMAPSAENPFGGMGMYMLMSTMLKKTGKDSDMAEAMKSKLPLILMGNHMFNGQDNNLFNNPMMWMLMMK